MEELLKLSLDLLFAFEEDLENARRDDPGRIECLKKLACMKYDFSREMCDNTILKAKAGIVGKSWYNENNGKPS